MLLSKIIFLAISLILSLVAIIPYYVGMWRKETKPHLLTWVIWCILTALGFVLSYFGGGGVGSFIFAFQSLVAFIVVVYALFRGEKNITTADWAAFCVALIILCFYAVTKNLLLSVLIQFQANPSQCPIPCQSFLKSYF